VTGLNLLILFAALELTLAVGIVMAFNILRVELRLLHLLLRLDGEAHPPWPDPKFPT